MTMPLPESCDTSVAVGPATVDGSVIFAKNSDRSANECQPLTHVPRQAHAPGALAQCQYLAIPQVADTWEMIGSRPHWLWGFEMGVNEWGVAIGNEAVLSREPYEEPAALIGMDLVRLGLERGRSAGEAVRVMTALVERYGQGGSCEATTFRTYHNSFIVADPTTAWVLETAGRRWVAHRVRDRAAISNLYTIGDAGDAIAAGAIEHAVAQGWAGEPFNFATAYQDPAADLRPRACRLERARAVLDGYGQDITVDRMQALLRDHGDGDLPVGPQDLPTICMHVAPGRGGETAGALVAHLRRDQPRELAVTAWVAFGSPCLSVFRPVYPYAVGLPDWLDRGGAQFDAASPWWVFERLQRVVAAAPTLAPLARQALGRLEAEFRREAGEVEAEAAHLLLRDERERARLVLRALVDSTSTRAVALARALADDLERQAAAMVNAAMADAWQPLNDAVGLGDLIAPAAVPTT
jgi:secernin